MIFTDENGEKFLQFPPRRPSEDSIAYLRRAQKEHRRNCEIIRDTDAAFVGLYMTRNGY